LNVFRNDNRLHALKLAVLTGETARKRQSGLDRHVWSDYRRRSRPPPVAAVLVRNWRLLRRWLANSPNITRQAIAELHCNGICETQRLTVAIEVFSNTGNWSKKPETA
jgi:hypothetical protein